MPLLARHLLCTTSSLFRFMDRRHSFHSVRIGKVSGLGRFEDETKHALFKLPVRNRKSIVLPRVLRPRLHDEILEIYAGILRIVIDAPAHGAVASSNPLVVVQCIQKFWNLLWIDAIFNGDKHRPFVGFRLRNHRQLSQWFHACNEPLAAGNRATTGSAKQVAMPMLENSSAVFALVCSAATPQSVLPSATLT